VCFVVDAFNCEPDVASFDVLQRRNDVTFYQTVIAVVVRNKNSLFLETVQFDVYKVPLFYFIQQIEDICWMLV